MSPVALGPAPQNAPNSDKPGSYELAIRSNKAEVAPGDTVDLEIFITGYGRISAAKIVFNPPSYFINSAWSTVTHGLGQHANGNVYFGKDEQPVQEDGCAIGLGGLGVPGWPSRHTSST
jgi:hypothetical protein